MQGAAGAAGQIVATQGPIVQGAAGVAGQIVATAGPIVQGAAGAAGQMLATAEAQGDIGGRSTRRPALSYTKARTGGVRRITQASPSPSDTAAMKIQRYIDANRISDHLVQDINFGHASHAIRRLCLRASESQDTEDLAAAGRANTHMERLESCSALRRLHTLPFEEVKHHVAVVVPGVDVWPQAFIAHLITRFTVEEYKSSDWDKVKTRLAFSTTTPWEQLPAFDPSNPAMLCKEMSDPSTRASCLAQAVLIGGICNISVKSSEKMFNAGGQEDAFKSSQRIKQATNLGVTLCRYAIDLINKARSEKTADMDEVMAALGIPSIQFEVVCKCVLAMWSPLHGDHGAHQSHAVSFLRANHLGGPAAVVKQTIIGNKQWKDRFDELMGLSIGADLAQTKLKEIMPTLKDSPTPQQVLHAVKELPVIKQNFGSFRPQGADILEHTIYTCIQDLTGDCVLSEGGIPSKDMVDAVCLAIVTLTETESQPMDGLKQSSLWMRQRLHETLTAAAGEDITTSAMHYLTDPTPANEEALRDTLMQQCTQQRIKVALDDDQQDVMGRVHSALSRNMAVAFPAATQASLDIAGIIGDSFTNMSDQWNKYATTLMKFVVVGHSLVQAHDAFQKTSDLTASAPEFTHLHQVLAQWRDGLPPLDGFQNECRDIIGKDSDQLEGFFKKAADITAEVLTSCKMVRERELSDKLKTAIQLVARFTPHARGGINGQSWANGLDAQCSWQALVSHAEKSLLNVDGTILTAQVIEAIEAHCV